MGVIFLLLDSQFMIPIVGHQRQIRYLERVLEKGTLAHAYLFHGPEGVGKRSVAVAVGQSLLCAKRIPQLGGCGVCEGCELVERHTHPDLTVLSVEEPLVAEEGRGPPAARLPVGQGRAGIGIKNIHELQRRLALSAWRGGRKVVIIDQAEALSRDAQSSLLKTLEEPDEKTEFFLIARSPDALLATVRSRALAMHFAILSDEELAPLVAAVPARERPELLSLAEGRPGMLIRLIQERAFLEERRVVAKRRGRSSEMDLARQFAFAEENARDPGVMESLLTHLIAVVRRDLHAAIGEAPQSPTAVSKGHTARLAEALALLLERLRILETTTANRRLVADSVFFELSSLGEPSS